MMINHVVDCIQTLEVGANVNQPNAQGMTPLAAATQNKQEASIQVLRAHGAQ